MSSRSTVVIFFFFNDTATTEIYTLSLHDALPISSVGNCQASQVDSKWKDPRFRRVRNQSARACVIAVACGRSEEHTSELQSQSNLVCRLLLEKKKKSRVTVIIASVLMTFGAVIKI